MNKLALVMCLLLIAGGLTYAILTDEVITSDGVTYYSVGKNLLDGKGYLIKPGLIQMQYPLGYSTSLVLPLLFGDTYLNLKIFSAILILISAGLVFWIASNQYDTKTAILATLIFGFNLRIMEVASNVSPHPLMILLILCAAIFLIKEKYIVAAIFLGLSTHVRYETVFMIAGLCLFFIIKKDWKKAISIALITFLVFSPWLIRNYISSGNLSNSSTGAGFLVDVFNIPQLFEFTMEQRIHPWNYILSHPVTYIKKWTIHFILIMFWSIPHIAYTFSIIPLLMFLIHPEELKRREWLFLVGGLVLAFTLTWPLQHYFLPFMPFMAIWIAKGWFILSDKINVPVMAIILTLVMLYMEPVVDFNFRQQSDLLQEPKELLYASQWLKDNVNPNETVVTCKIQAAYHANRMNWETVPQNMGIDLFKKFLTDKKLRWIVYNERENACISDPELKILLNQTANIEGFTHRAHVEYHSKSAEVWEFNPDLQLYSGN